MEKKLKIYHHNNVFKFIIIQKTIKKRLSKNGNIMQEKVFVIKKRKLLLLSGWFVNENINYKNHNVLAFSFF